MLTYYSQWLFRVFNVDVVNLPFQFENFFGLDLYVGSLTLQTNRHSSYIISSTTMVTNNVNSVLLNYTVDSKNTNFSSCIVVYFDLVTTNETCMWVTSALPRPSQQMAKVILATSGHWTSTSLSVG